MSPYHKLCWENGSLPAPLPSVDSTVSDPASDDLAPVLWMERFQISTTWMGFIISAILLILSLLSQRLYYNKIFKAVVSYNFLYGNYIFNLLLILSLVSGSGAKQKNFGFYFVFSVLLITSAIFVAYAAFDIDRKICKNYYEDMSDCQQYKLKMASAVSTTYIVAVIYERCASQSRV